MESSFDPTSFLDATIDQPLTRRPPIPAGTEVIGTIGELTQRQWTGKQDPSKHGWAIDFPITLDLSTVPGLAERLGVPQVTINDGIMLDLKEDGKTIDQGPGKNGALRRYREALDMNKPGDNFSFRMMTGRQIRVKIKLEEYKGELYEKVGGVSRV